MKKNITVPYDRVKHLCMRVKVIVSYLPPNPIFTKQQDRRGWQLVELRKIEQKNEGNSVQGFITQCEKYSFVGLWEKYRSKKIEKLQEVYRGKSQKKTIQYSNASRKRRTFQEKVHEKIIQQTQKKQGKMPIIRKKSLKLCGFVARFCLNPAP